MKFFVPLTILWGTFTAIFYIRYPFALTRPNFYAEDGKVFVANVLALGPIEAMFQLFNGYLVVGQYIIVNVGMLINAVVGGSFVTIPKGLAIASYLFLGLMCCLPWLLFRKKMGAFFSILAGALIALVPLGSFDWTVIGTIGNLKFAFLYLGFMLIIYRNQVLGEPDRRFRIVVIDALLLLCILTNITTLALLPLGLMPYRKQVKQHMKKWNIKLLLKSCSFISLIILGVVGVAYIVGVYAIGIPKMPGYLDQPLNIEGLLNTFYRGSIYGLLYPLHASMTTALALVLTLAMFVGLIFLDRKDRKIAGAAMCAIVVCVLGFALARTGVTEYYSQPTAGGGPGQFFYGGTMIFIFAVSYLLSRHARIASIRSRAVVYSSLALYLVWAVPLAGYREKSLAEYGSVLTIVQTTQAACAAQASSHEKVDVMIYPSVEWYMSVDKKVACQ